MSKTASASGKSKRPSISAAAGKADHNAVDGIVIGKKRSATTTTSTSSSSSVRKKKKTAAATTKNAGAPLPLPGEWPVSSKFSYPAVHTDEPDDRLSSSYLRPGGLLRRSCNGSDVFLRKRAVQSASASLFNIANGGGGGGGGGGGPSRFLIVFPGRLSLRSPPRASEATVDASSVTAAATTTATSDDVVVGSDIIAGDDDDDHDDDDGPNDDDGEVRREDDSKVAAGRGRRNPFAPAHPPRLLGRLVPSSGGDGCVELRIPFPPSSSSSSYDGANENDATTTTTAGEEVRELVMSGRSLPISGKYMALSFKRTGGTRESVSSSGGGKNGKDGRVGTGSITCKDVFRSVIVLGESHLLDDDGKAAPLGTISSSTKANSDGDDKLKDGSCIQMKHYGGSERTVDGGGRCDGGANCGRKSSSGGVTEVSAARIKLKDSGSSRASTEFDSGDKNEYGDSSDVDKFVPIAPNRRKSTTRSKKREQMDESDDEEEEEITPTRDRAPRRSVTAAKVSYVDESSDSDLDDGTAESSRGDESGEEVNNRPKSMPKAIQPDLKKNVPNLVASKESGKFKDGSVRSKSTDQGKDCKPRGVQKGKKLIATNNVSNGAAALKATKKDPPAASMKKLNDVIEIKSDDDDGETMSTPTKRLDVHEQRLHGISTDPKKRLSALSSASKSPSKSPISYGRRKKNSPKVEKGPNKGNDIDLSLDDDAFTFF